LSCRLSRASSQSSSSLSLLLFTERWCSRRMGCRPTILTSRTSRTSK
jgi:hypothetical protein